MSESVQTLAEKLRMGMLPQGEWQATLSELAARCEAAEDTLTRYRATAEYAMEMIEAGDNEAALGALAALDGPKEEQ